MRSASCQQEPDAIGSDASGYRIHLDSSVPPRSDVVTCHARGFLRCAMWPLDSYAPPRSDIVTCHACGLLGCAMWPLDSYVVPPLRFGHMPCEHHARGFSQAVPHRRGGGAKSIRPGTQPPPPRSSTRRAMESFAVVLMPASLKVDLKKKLRYPLPPWRSDPVQFRALPLCDLSSHHVCS